SGRDGRGSVGSGSVGRGSVGRGSVGIGREGSGRDGRGTEGNASEGSANGGRSTGPIAEPDGTPVRPLASCRPAATRTAARNATEMRRRGCLRNGPTHPPQPRGSWVALRRHDLGPFVDEGHEGGHEVRIELLPGRLLEPAH